MSSPHQPPFNPYASPQAPFQPPIRISSPFAPSDTAIWREGSRLRMLKTAQLPEVCVRTNAAATTSVRRNYAWHHPALALTILIGVLIYVILVLVLQKKATVVLPLSQEAAARRRSGILWCWLSGLFGFLVLVGGIVLVAAAGPDNPELGLLGALTVLVGFVIPIIALVVGQQYANVLAAKYIDDHYVVLAGANADYLARFPDWTGPRG